MTLTFQSYRLADGGVELLWLADGLPHRGVRSPGDDLTDLPSGVRTAIAETWTHAFIADWKAANDIDQPVTEEDRIAQAVAAIQARRAQAIVAFSYMGQAVELSAQTQQDIGNAIAALARKPQGATICWEIVDGAYVEMDLPTLEAFGDAAFDHIQACFANSEALTAKVTAGEAIDIGSGWPA